MDDTKLIWFTQAKVEPVSYEKLRQKVNVDIKENKARRALCGVINFLEDALILLGARLLGFFDSGNTVSGTSSTPNLSNFAGIRFHEEGVTFSNIRTGGDGHLAGTFVNLQNETNYLLDVQWDPNGGTGGGGLLVSSFSGPGGGSSSLDLTSAQRSTLSSNVLNSFGWYRELINPRSTSPQDARMDDVTYSFGTAEVPEPTTTALLALGLLGAGLSVRRHRLQ